MRQTVAIAKPLGFCAAMVWAWGWWAGLALAGPPLETDDPETPGEHGWEVNLSDQLERTRRQFRMEAPRIDINYGRRENDQWKLELPVTFLDPEGGESHWGVGDVLLGWKHRFLDEEDRGFMMSVYPQMLVPTGSKRLDLGKGRAELLLPVEVGRHFFDERLFVYGEAGYSVALEQSDADFWKLGLAAQWKATEKLSWMVEAGAFVFPRAGEPDDPFFKVGFQYQFREHVSLIASAGRSLRDGRSGTPEFSSYLGLQFTWGGHKPEDENPGNGKGPKR